MDMIQAANQITLCGVPLSEPRLSHTSRQERFYSFPLEVIRLSGNSDRLNIILREETLECFRTAKSGLLGIRGELRSFNNRSGVGNRLVITVLAQELFQPEAVAWVNTADLSGTLCKAPNFRTTPMGREICDLMLAVNRRYGRSDYIPCIAWGAHARRASQWAVGQRLRVLGRIQSREYIKNIDGESVRRTAFELSATDLIPLDADFSPL